MLPCPQSVVFGGAASDGSSLEGLNSQLRGLSQALVKVGAVPCCAAPCCASTPSCAACARRWSRWVLRHAMLWFSATMEPNTLVEQMNGIVAS
jgi:hypothetical protein